MSKCAYCNKEIDTLYPLTAGEEKEAVNCCSEKCCDKTQAFYHFVDQTRPLFLIGILLSMLLILGSAFILVTPEKTVGARLMSVGIGLLGLSILVFPFATPQTFGLLGIRKTLWLTRAIGLIFIAVSPFLAVWLVS